MALRCICAVGTIMFAAALVASSAPLGVATATLPAGRWEGALQVPASPIPIVLDIEKSEASGWVGSAIFPGFGVKGAPLKDLSVDGSAITFTVKNAMGEPKISAQLVEDGTLVGKYEQGGNSVPLSLKRVGAAQVDLPRLSTPIQKGLEGDWQGLLDLGAFKMRLGLKLASGEKGRATGQLIMLDSGNQTSAVELITEEGDNLELTIPAFNFGYEGRFDKASDELKGIIRAGSLELPLVWRRSAK